MSIPYPQNEPFTGLFGVGGGGGSPWAEYKWKTNDNGLIVKRLDVWWNDSCLQGIQVTYSDNSRSKQYGSFNNNHDALDLAPGERITNMSLWGNGKGTRCGRIRIITDGGKDFNKGKDVTGQTEYSAGVGSGILVGMVGRSGTEIDLLGPIFLDPDVKTISVSDLNYYGDLTGSQGITQVTLNQASYENPKGDQNPILKWDFTGSSERETSTTFTQSSSTTYGVNVTVEVSAEIFGIGAKTSTTYEWEKSDTQTTESSTTEKMAMSWSAGGELKPGETATATAFCYQAIGSLRYDAQVQIVLLDGWTSTYRETGVFRTALFTIASTKVKYGTVTEGPAKPVEIHSTEGRKKAKKVIMNGTRNHH